MNVSKMPRGHAYWDYDGDGQFNKCLALGKDRKWIRRFWIKEQKKKMDDNDEYYDTGNTR